MPSGRGIRISLSGKAIVVCVHDREKRIVTTERHLYDLGLRCGIPYDPKQQKTHLCTCCGNLFVDPTDEPNYCHACRVPLVHAAGGPLPEPKGVVA